MALFQDKRAGLPAHTKQDRGSYTAASGLDELPFPGDDNAQRVWVHRRENEQAPSIFQIDLELGTRGRLIFDHRLPIQLMKRLKLSFAIIFLNLAGMMDQPQHVASEAKNGGIPLTSCMGCGPVPLQVVKV